MRKCLLFTKSTLKIKAGIFPCPGVTIKFSSIIVFGISETRIFSFDVVLRLFRGSSTKTNSVLFMALYIF